MLAAGLQNMNLPHILQCPSPAADPYYLCRHELEQRDSSTLAACIIEPILQGANGMRMIDPLFQRILVEACR